MTQLSHIPRPVLATAPRPNGFNVVYCEDTAVRLAVDEQNGLNEMPTFVRAIQPQKHFCGRLYGLRSGCRYTPTSVNELYLTV